MMQESRPESGLVLPGPLDAVARNLGRASRTLRSRVDSMLHRVGNKNTDECPSDGFTMRVTQDAPPRALAVLPRGNFAAIIPGESVAETVITTGISSTLSLYQSALIVRIILTWFPSAPAAIQNPLSTICDPYLNIFRGIIPPIGGTIDLSPILAFVALDFLTGSAASLGAEMPSNEAPEQPKTS
eukprot:jgi/Ulvmu1/6415/UM003_0044.1